jgi:hypothetical protein
MLVWRLAITKTTSVRKKRSLFRAFGFLMSQATYKAMFGFLRSALSGASSSGEADAPFLGFEVIYERDNIGMRTSFKRIDLSYCL